MQAQVLPNDAIVGGKPLNEWTPDYWKWYWQTPTNNHPSLDPDGRWATNGQPGGPVFLAAIRFTHRVNSGIRTFSMPEDTYLFCPVMPGYAENVDSCPPCYSVEELRDALNAFVTRDIHELHASVDGVPVIDLWSHRLRSPPYSYILTNANNFKTYLYGHPITGLIDPEIADGYYIMIAPLSVGTHVINFGGSSALGIADVTDIITVVPVPLVRRVQNLIVFVEGSNLSLSRQQPLLASLDAARASLGRTNLVAAIGQLDGFQNKVRAQVAPNDAALADQLSNSAQRIIDKAASDLTKP